MDKLLEWLKVMDNAVDYTIILSILVILIGVYKILPLIKDNEKVMEKLLSGRYYLTIIGGIAFIYAIINKLLEAQAISAILTAIFLSYFQRSDRKQENGESK